MSSIGVTVNRKLEIWSGYGSASVNGGTAVSFSGSAVGWQDLSFTGTLNTLAVTGIATTTGFVQGYVTVLTTFENINDSLSVLGVTSNTYSSRNTQYQISGYEIGESKKVQVSTASSMTGIAAASTMGIGATACARAIVQNAGPGIGITYFSYDYLSGIATVGSGVTACLLYTSPSPRDATLSRMPSSA